ncbi:hypothetical protein ACFSF0_13705 [Ottowia flava]|uniref:Uncharacterized protein n=1 Tax=Ottowia flava TaxID=2675430 RepID=A0ABW4KWV7_9BURK|nr:hypothetical protein [Ottowia sp. GY511]
MNLLIWGSLAMAFALAYTAWAAARDGTNERDVKALWCFCGFSFILAGLFAAIVHLSPE